MGTLREFENLAPLHLKAFSLICLEGVSIFSSVWSQMTVSAMTCSPSFRVSLSQVHASVLFKEEETSLPYKGAGPSILYPLCCVPVKLFLCKMRPWPNPCNLNDLLSLYTQVSHFFLSGSSGHCISTRSKFKDVYKVLKSRDYSYVLFGRFTVCTLSRSSSCRTLRPSFRLPLTVVWVLVSEKWAPGPADSACIASAEALCLSFPANGLGKGDTMPVAGTRK